MRWLKASEALSRPNYIDYYAVRPLVRSDGRRNAYRTPDLACVQTRTCRRARVPPTIDFGADIKSP